MCRNFEQGFDVRLQGTYTVLVDCEAGELKVCDPKLTFLLVVRRFDLGACVEKRVYFAVVVSVAVADDHDVLEKVRDSVETMSNLADKLPEAGWC